MSDTLWIGGVWRASATGETLPIVNPANGRVIAQVAGASSEDVNAAVEAAARAFPRWSATSGRERAAFMHRAMEIFRTRYLDETAELLTKENGKPLNDSLKECRFAADVIDFYADESRRISGAHFSGDMGATHSFIVQEPVGVVAAIVPWNFPVDLLAWKIGPGLAAGCTFVIKPSEEASLSVLRFLQSFIEADLPAGVLNAVTGAGAVGAALVRHPGVQKIAFTGSTEVGRWIGEQAGKLLKRVTLELGGSAPFIVCADADLEQAVAQAARRCYSHSGQICISVNRIFVQEGCFEAFLDRFVAHASQLRVAADGLREPDADMGPMINAAAVAKVEQQVADAVARGARVLVGGSAPAGAEYDPGGFFYSPTVLTEVTPAMQVMSQETFGPVAPVAAFRTLDDAIAMANDTPFGLAAYVYTLDINNAYHAARHLRFGGIGINVNDVTDIRAPFGGMKHSGVGRELGQPGLESYLETKHVRLGYRTPGEG